MPTLISSGTRMGASSAYFAEAEGTTTSTAGREQDDAEDGDGRG